MNLKDDLRSKIIGLGRNSLRKSYYPSLQKKIGELNLFYSVFENLSDLILIVDHSTGLLSYANYSARTIFQIEDPKVHDIKIHDIIDDSLYKEINKCFIEKQEASESRIFEYKITEDKFETIYEISVDYLKIDQESIQTIIFRDITERKKNVEHIAQREALLNSIIENIPFNIWARDTDERGTLQNSISIQKWGSFIGKKPEEQNIPIETLRLWKQNHAIALKGDIVDNIEYIEDIEGKKRHYRNILAPIFNKKNIEGVLGMNIDITDRVRAENALMQSEKRFRNYIEYSPTAVFIADFEGNYTFVNDAACKMLGYPREELLFLGMEKLALERDLQQVQIDFGKLLVEGILQNYQMILVAKDGREIPVILNSVKTGKNEIIGFITNLTQVKKTERILAQREEDLIETQEIAKIARFEYSFVTQKYEFSRNFREVLGLEGSEFEKNFNGIESLIHHAHPDDREKLLFQFKKAFDQFEDFEFNFRNIDVDSNIRYYSTITKYEFDEHNKPTKLISVIQDYTQQKINEQLLDEIQLAEETASLKHQFLANMSHEIRTPMTGIVGMIDFLLQTKLSDTQHEYVKTIKESSEVLMSIVNDVLNLSKIEAGRFELMPKIFCPSNTIDEMERLFRIKAENKDLKFKTVCTLSPEVKVYADEIRIKQIISNLVSNSIKYTDQGEVTLILSHKIVDDKIVFIKVSVKDTGIGIKQEDQERLFRKFSQVHANSTTIEQGIGLGLVISKEIAELMDGEIGFDSEEGKGSEFWFTLYLPISDENQYTETFKVPQSINLKKKVLFAEDKKVNQKVVSLMLERFGCEVTIANNGKEAIDLIANSDYSYDIVFMDIQMPVMDGITAVKTLRNTLTKLPPIIGLSANAMEGDAEKYIADGLDDYLSKPVSKEMLYQKLIKWIN